MSSNVEAANFTQYNANSRGTRSTDCVKRAISMAFDIDYNQVSKMLTSRCKALASDSWKTRPIFDSVIKELGGKHITKKEMGDPVLVSDFIDAHPNGSYIMLTGPKSTGHTDHMTCAIDGTLFDTWDSSNQYVFDYYIVEGVAHVFTDISDETPQLFQEGMPLIETLSRKYHDKYKLEGDIVLDKHSYSGDFNLVYFITYENDPYLSSDVDLKLTCVFTPTMTYEQAQKKMTDTIKVRIYDFFYAINQKLQNKREEISILKQGNYNPKDLERAARNKSWLHGAEKRFYESLPGWAKALLLRIDINAPGQFSDSYSLTLLPLPNDPRKSYVDFDGYDAGMIRSMLDDYKTKLERPYDDYSPYERY